MNLNFLHFYIKDDVEPADGFWKSKSGRIIQIKSHKVHWRSEGNKINELRFSNATKTAINMTKNNIEKHGFLSQNGSQIIWSDNDIWNRLVRINIYAKFLVYYASLSFF